MHKAQIRISLIFGTLLLIAFSATVFSLMVGEITLSPFQILHFIIESEPDNINYLIFEKIRVPRILLGFVVGGGLSLSGVILQGIYRNPLVEPYTLGISGGAAMGATLAIALGIHNSYSGLFLPFSGFIGSISAISLVYFIATRQGAIQVRNMLLIGVMISFISSSVMMFTMSIVSSETLHGIIFWIMGSLDEPNTWLIHLTAILSIVALIISYYFAKPLNALRLGESSAHHLGINTNFVIKSLFIITSLLTGICVSIAGIIAFVGLIIPHLMRLILGNDYRILLLSSFIGGGTFLVLCDTIARTIISPNELPVGVITGFIGGILFIIIYSQKTKGAKL